MSLLTTDMSFGGQLKKLRLATFQLSMRQFCDGVGYDYGNWSKMENNLLPPPSGHKKVQAYIIDARLNFNAKQMELICMAAYLRHKERFDALWRPEVNALELEVNPTKEK